MKTEEDKSIRSSLLRKRWKQSSNGNPTLRLSDDTRLTVFESSFGDEGFSFSVSRWTTVEAFNQFHSHSKKITYLHGDVEQVTLHGLRAPYRARTILMRDGTERMQEYQTVFSQRSYESERQAQIASIDELLRLDAGR